MKHIILNTGVTYYREWGSGGDPTILVLHGWGVDSSQYEQMGPMLAKRSFHVIVPDLPGFGNTPAPKKAWGDAQRPKYPRSAWGDAQRPKYPRSAWGVGEYVEWVREFIVTLHNPSPPPLILRGGDDRDPPLKVRGGRGSYDNKIILFGHSFGGRIAIKYAVKYPEQLRALVLCAAAGIKPPLTFKRVALYLAAKIGRTIFKPPGLSFTGEILKRILYRLAGVTDYLKARGIMKEVLAKTVKEDLKPLLPKIKTPTLILWGEDDQTTPLKDAYTMARLIPGAKLTTFPGARHNLPTQIPEKIVETIVQYSHTS